jgi:hypothetical protein
MRQMNQDGSHDQQEAAELLRGVNAANSQFVLTEVALKTSSWEAEPNGEERERHENAFRHARSVLQAMTADRGRAGAQAMHCWESNLPPRGTFSCPGGATFLCPGVTFSCPGVTVLRPRGIFLCPGVNFLYSYKTKSPPHITNQFFF